MPDAEAALSPRAVKVAVLTDAAGGVDPSVYLAKSGLSVQTVSDEAELDSLLEIGDTDGVVLHMGAPSLARLEFCSQIAGRRSVGIVALGLSGEVADKIVALECGADDYLHDPCSLRELLARLRAVTRGRKASRPTERPPRQRFVYQFNDWSFDLYCHDLISPEGRRIVLTPSEFSLLYALVNAPQKLLSRKQLLEMIGSSIPVVSGKRSVDVLVSRLRRKLSDSDHQILKTKRSLGYVMAVDAVVVAK